MTNEKKSLESIERELKEKAFYEKSISKKTYILDKKSLEMVIERTKNVNARRGEK